MPIFVSAKIYISIYRYGYVRYLYLSLSIYIFIGSVSLGNPNTGIQGDWGGELD